VRDSFQLIYSSSQNGKIRLFSLSTTAEDDKLIEPEKIISGHQGKERFTGNV
jgi:hypothetical protein